MSVTPSTKSPITTITFAGAELELHADGALYWPAEDMLIVSDLHLEKASFLARFGSALPHYDTLDTLMRLDKLLHHYRPRQVVALGDSFHDADAFRRLPETERAYLHQLVARVDTWHWILGNHDTALSHALHGEMQVNHRCADILLTHEPEDHPLPQIIGHYHPKMRVSLGGRGVSGKCFLLAEKLLIMPSFGSFTGGLNCRDAAITCLSPTPFQHYLLYNQKIWQLGSHEN